MTVADSERPGMENITNNGRSLLTFLNKLKILFTEAIVPAFNCLSGENYKVPPISGIPLPRPIL